MHFLDRSNTPLEGGVGPVQHPLKGSVGQLEHPPIGGCSKKNRATRNLFNSFHLHPPQHFARSPGVTTQYFS